MFATYRTIPQYMSHASWFGLQFIAVVRSFSHAQRTRHRTGPTTQSHPKGSHVHTTQPRGIRVWLRRDQTKSGLLKAHPALMSSLINSPLSFRSVGTTARSRLSIARAFAPPSRRAVRITACTRMHPRVLVETCVLSLSAPCLFAWMFDSIRKDCGP